jgi:uncharacterized protein (DUF1800 family)
MVTWNDENAAHLLRRAGFGGSPKDIAKFVKYGQETAVEKLVSARPNSAKGPGKSGDKADDPDDRLELQVWWAKRMVKATSRRLQEKMCLFWHDHFASSISVTRNNLRMALQNRTFRRLGLGPFRDLVFEVTRDAAMLDFLDGDRNRVGRPNENYGRELMELFVLGVSDLNGTDNYTQADVQEIARALTGFQIIDDVGQFVPSRFDGGSKTLFAGKSFQAAGVLGVVENPGGADPVPPEAQVPRGPAQNVIDILFTHRDSDGKLTMPRFLAKKLWEWFAHPNPSKALLDQLTVDFIAGGFVVGDLLRAIFLHDDFYGAQAKTSSVKNPCEYAFHAMRALDAKTNAKTLPGLIEAMGLTLFDPPSVNGWPNGLAWVSSGQFLARIEFAQALAAGRESELRLRPEKLIDGSATTAAAIVDDLLDRLGIAASVPVGARQALIDYLGPGTIDVTDTTVVERKVRGVILLMLTLPEFHIH